MPGVTLRLTDEEHARLTREASQNHRSLQKEILHRLFPPMLPGAIPHGATATARALQEWDDHFKPDPKPTKAEKKGRR